MIKNKDSSYTSECTVMKMATYNIVEMQKKLRKYIDEMRYVHTQGVMYTAAALAMCYGEDLERAQVAGLLHDCAKCIPNAEKLKLCKQNDIAVTETEKEAPSLLHSKLGAFIAKKKYGVEDQEILDAIACHTVGKPAMTMLEKIIFLADYIEPNRTKAPNLTQIRAAAFTDIDQAVYLTMRDTLSYLEEEKAKLDNQTIVAYNYYKDLMENKEA